MPRRSDERNVVVIGYLLNKDPAFCSRLARAGGAHSRRHPANKGDEGKRKKEHLEDCAISVDQALR